MKYTDDEYVVMRYFAKVKNSGLLMLAHLKCLKPTGNDYETLRALQVRKNDGEAVNEVIPYVDAEFDFDLVKSHFAERDIMDEKRFDAALEIIKTDGLVDDAGIASDTAKNTYQTLEVVRTAEIEALNDRTLVEIIAEEVTEPIIK